MPQSVRKQSRSAKKNQIITGLTRARSKILDAASVLSPEQQDQVFLGVWSVKDLLAHLAGWDYTNVEAVKELVASQLPKFYAYSDRDWKTYNARLVEEYKKDDFAGLVSSVSKSHQTLIDFLKTVPAEEFEKDRAVRFKGYKVTLARLLQAEIDDEKIHYDQIKQFFNVSLP